jgi:predicted small integral membrane protein
MTLRLCKVALVACAAFFLLLVVFNNLTDPGSNLKFVRHVLSMDDTFQGNSGRWRALPAPRVHLLFYGIIVLWEGVSAAMIGAGAWRLWRARRAGAAGWQAAKSLAVAGLTVSLVQWFAAFLSVGGEWFLMWQSKQWNGQEAALRMFAIQGIVLLFLCQREDGPQGLQKTGGAA